MKPLYKFSYYIITLLFITMCTSLASNGTHKILYIDSYHGNPWSSTIEHGIKSVIEQHHEIDLKVFRMDTKHFPSEESKKAAALKAKKIIEEWQPDIVIASDDNATRYLLVPYFKNSNIPFVVCGINLDASEYKLPFKNATGMVETFFAKESIELMKPFAKGNKIGFLASDNFSSHKAYKFLSKKDNINFSEVYFAKDFDDLKKGFLEIQQKVDMLYMCDTYSVKNFNLNEMIEFSNNHTIIPTAGTSFIVVKHSLLGAIKSGVEHGVWSATTALDILHKKKPPNLPIVENKKINYYLNISIAKKLGIKFPITLIDRSRIITNKKHSILFVSYYSYNCPFFKEIKNGLLASLDITQISKSVFDNTESNVEFHEFIHSIISPPNIITRKEICMETLKAINSLKPDILIATYDSTLKYLIDNYSNEIQVPIIICGINLDVSIFNPLTKKLEVTTRYKLPKKILSLTKNYSSGNKIGYIGFNNNITKEAVNALKEFLNIDFSKGYFVSSYKDYKEKFLTLQNEVDLIYNIIFCDPSQWDSIDAENFFKERTTIPTIDYTVNKHSYSLFGNNHIAVKQGWIAGKTALNILSTDKININSFPYSNESSIVLNQKIAENLDISLPIKTLKSLEIK